MLPCDVLIVTVENNDAYSHSNLYDVWKKTIFILASFRGEMGHGGISGTQPRVDMGHLFFTFFATFCTVVTTNSSRLYKFLPSMLLLLIIIIIIIIIIVYNVRKCRQILFDYLYVCN